MAESLASQLLKLPGVRAAWPTQANELFFVLPKAMHDALTAAGAVYYEWPVTGLPEDDELGEGEVFVRLVTSFATTTAEVEAFVAVAAGAASGNADAGSGATSK